MGKIRNEEYSTLGGFLIESFGTDRPEIEIRFPKLNDVFFGAFKDQLIKVKNLEGSLKFTEQEKKATESLYSEAYEVNVELNFLSSYMKDAGLSTDAVSKLKRSLTTSNIEGALLQLKDVKGYVLDNKDALVAEGMSPDYPAKMDDHIDSMDKKNVLQNKVLQARKQLVSDNKADYKKLYSFISTVAEKGKLVFAGTVKEDNYSISKLLKKMRAPKKGGGDENQNPPA